MNMFEKLPPDIKGSDANLTPQEIKDFLEKNKDEDTSKMEERGGDSE
jgi:hypothetical protein